MTGWIEEEEKIALGGPVMRLEPWSRPKRKYFLFLISCMIWKGDKKHFYSIKKKSNYWLAGWISCYFHSIFYLKEQLTDFGIWQAFSQKRTQMILSLQRKTTDSMCCQWWRYNFRKLLAATKIWQLPKTKNFSDGANSVRILINMIFS